MLSRDEIPTDYQNGTLLKISNNSGVIGRVTPSYKPFSVVSLLSGIKKDAIQISQGIPLTTSATGFTVDVKASEELAQGSSFGSNLSNMLKNSGLLGGTVDKSKSEFNNSGIVQKKPTEPEPKQETDLVPIYIGGGIFAFIVLFLIVISIVRRP